MAARRFEHALLVTPPTGQDRAAVAAHEHGLVIVLADGAGGTGRGATAAHAVVDAVLASPFEDASRLLAGLDDPRRLGLGETTAVIATLRGDHIVGASVGDSGAWLVRADDVVDLTEHQVRKPLLGAGGSPVAFTARLEPGATLLVASDGLWKYGPPADIARIARGPSLAAAAAALVELVRMPSGRLQDDISIVLVR